MPDSSELQTEIDKNLEHFLRELPELVKTQRGKFALLRHQKNEGYYDTITDALTAANSMFPDKLFSIQQVTETATDLGFFSYAMPMADAQ